MLKLVEARDQRISDLPSRVFAVVAAVSVADDVGLVVLHLDERVLLGLKDMK